MKKVYSEYFGNYWQYVAGDAKILEHLKYLAETFFEKWVYDLNLKRPGYFDKLKATKSQIIHRQPLVDSSFSQVGTYGIKVRVEAPKWPMRKLINWKRPKKKKWQNNKRVYA